MYRPFAEALCVLDSYQCLDCISDTHPQAFSLFVDYCLTLVLLLHSCVMQFMHTQASLSCHFSRAAQASKQ